MNEAGRYKAALRAKVRSGEREPSQHGWVGYNEGCLCDVCRAGNTAKTATARARRRLLPAEAIPHGLGGYDNYGCPCEVCREAHRTRRADQRAAKKAA